jgi:hypothetical protein
MVTVEVATPFATTGLVPVMVELAAMAAAPVTVTAGEVVIGLEVKLVVPAVVGAVTGP